MRRFLVLVALAFVLAGCSGGPGAAPSGQPSTGSATPAPSVEGGTSAAPSAEATTAPSEAPSSAAGALPADCAAGFAEYLVAIEPIVASFDPASATLGDLSTADQAVGDKSYELLQANDSTAPYSCPEAGLQWSYFDSNTAWDAALAVAAEAAPGTVAYLTALRTWTGLDVAVAG